MALPSTLTLPAEPHVADAPQPRWIHAFILLVTSGLSVLVTALLGPSLPLMQQHFADVPGVDYLVPLTMAVPMLMMALLSVFVGLLSDRVGRKRLLVGATLLYGFFGTAPLYLEGLGAIVASRSALGVMEAVLMTVSTTMIGDYYRGAQRERFMALQVTVASTSAFLLNNLGGVIAEHGWRAPYMVYAISFVLVPLMAFYLWEPLAHGRDGQVLAEHGDDTPFSARLLGGICAMGIVTGLVFLVVPVHFAYLFNAIGVQAPAQIGMAYGLNSLGVITGTLVFGWVFARRLPVALQIGLSSLVAAVGFLLMQQAHSYETLVLAGMLNGLGCGILLPTMVTWTMRSLPLAQRGMGNGAFQSSFCFGEFLSALTVVGLQNLLGGQRAAAVGVIGLALALLGAGALLIGFTRRRG